MRTSSLPALLCLCLSALAPARAALADEWEPVSDRDGVRVERRAAPGTSYDELRLSARSALPVARLAAALWADRADGRFTSKQRVTRQVLEERADERLVYERTRAPIVKDRDYVVRQRRSFEPRTGVFHLDFRADDGGPGPRSDCVRLKQLWGRWTITPTSDGGSDVVYVVFSEPGGGVPAFLVRKPQVAATREVVLEVLEWARSHPAQAMR